MACFALLTPNDGIAWIQTCVLQLARLNTATQKPSQFTFLKRTMCLLYSLLCSLQLTALNIILPIQVKSRVKANVLSLRTMKPANNTFSKFTHSALHTWRNVLSALLHLPELTVPPLACVSVTDRGWRVRPFLAHMPTGYGFLWCFDYLYFKNKIFCNFWLRYVHEKLV